MTHPFSRRSVLWAALLAAGGSLCGPALAMRGRASCDDWWRERLTPMQYYVLRRGGTERPFSHPLMGEARAGLYACAGCGHALFQSSARVDAGGWPGFGAALPAAVERSRDGRAWCGACGGHLGCATDGCIAVNGAALTFLPA